MKTLASVLSNVIHPFLIPSIVFGILIFGDSSLSTSSQWIQFLITLFFCQVFIIIYLYVLKARGAIQTVDVDERLLRLNPLSIAVVFYLLGFALLWWQGASQIVLGLMFCYAMNTMVILFITRWWKISIHATAISGPLTALTFVYGWQMWPAFFLILVVGWSRVALGRHTVSQVIAGAGLAIIMTAIQLQLIFL